MFPIDILLTKCATHQVTWCIGVVQKLTHWIWGKVRSLIVFFRLCFSYRSLAMLGLTELGRIKLKALIKGLWVLTEVCHLQSTIRTSLRDTLFKSTPMQQNLPPLVLTLSRHMSHHRAAVWNFRDAFFLHLKQIEHIQSYSAGIIASSTHSSWGKPLVDTLENERHMESSLLMSPLVKHWCFHILVWETTKQIITVAFLNLLQSISEPLLISMENSGILLSSWGLSDCT